METVPVADCSPKYLRLSTLLDLAGYQPHHGVSGHISCAMRRVGVLNDGTHETFTRQSSATTRFFNLNVHAVEAL
jgi:hypothetical protein